MIKKEKTKIDSSLLNEYRAASYHIYSNPPFIFKVGQYSADLKILMNNYKKNTAAFVTAFNPQSKELILKENQIRNRQLEQEIRLLDFFYIKGDGRCNESETVGEESFLIFGITRDQSTYLAMNYDQNAIIWCGEDAKPQLLLVR